MTVFRNKRSHSVRFEQNNYFKLTGPGSSPFMNGSVTVPRRATSKSCQTVDFGNRSAGDGDSSIEESKCQNLDEDRSRILLARRPDGRPEDNLYATLRLEHRQETNTAKQCITNIAKLLNH